MLKIKERRTRGYQWFDGNAWQDGALFGDAVNVSDCYCRVRIAPRATKAIATRATVRAAFRDGRIVTRMERNDSGLGEKEMRATIGTWDLAPLIGVKYIMLEIQREGEP